MKRIKLTIFILIPMLFLGIFAFKTNAQTVYDNKPHSNDSDIYSPYTWYKEDGSYEWSSGFEDFSEYTYVSKEGSYGYSLTFPIYQQYLSMYEVMIYDLTDLFMWLEDRELLTNFENFDLVIYDDAFVEYPYYYEYSGEGDRNLYYVYIGKVENNTIARNGLMTFKFTTDKNNDNVVWNMDVMFSLFKIRFMTKWKIFEEMKRYFQNGLSIEPNASKYFQDGWNKGNASGYQDGYKKGLNAGEGYQLGYGEGKKDGILLNSEESYQEGLKAGIKEGKNQSVNSFQNNFHKWIVPAIIIVILVGGFVAFRNMNKKGDL